MDIQKIQPRNSFMSDKLFPILHSLVKSYIVEIRQHPIIVDADVAALYGVETKRVNEAVKNNPDKFPEDYMCFDIRRVKGFAVENFDHKSINQEPFTT